ncbi:kinase-like domain-containing protein [Hypoxylon argillaceum]|nr:kinase-like domain-containing protein [Hypoxylon argillaceum]
MSASTPISGSGEAPPLRSAIKYDDDRERVPDSSATSGTKAVQIAEPESVPSSPEENLPKRQFSAGLAKRLSGRSPMPFANSSRSSLLSQTSLEALGDLSKTISAQQTQEDSAQSQPPRRHRIDAVGERIIAQVAEWLEHERTKRHSRKAKRAHGSRRKHQKEDAEGSEPQSTAQTRRFSLDSQSSEVSFDRLQRIIDDSMSSLGLSAIPNHSPRLGRKSQRRRSIALHRTASSDTEFHDGDVLVPGCDGVLDNSKTLSYTGGNATSEEAALSSKRREEKERKAWLVFKNEVIRLSHTLRLKGWRRVHLDSGDTISVERLSGALTNAVYVVNPPEDMTGKTEGSKKNPAKLLLRVYGPQVEHIIDRENELSVLRRLARKKIGPRLLGTFANGRFEQYLNAITLTAEDLKDPDTSKQIAKRMRELHDGMELLEDEKDGGPAVLKNWDNWHARVSQAISFLDAKILAGNLGPVRNPADAWKERGFVCGTDWPTFKAMFDRYRQFVFERYGGSKVVREHLVFCHNDTQYGNILRVRPDDKKSPLLLPNFEHKQLVVIDFEYAAANVRGYEFANHFSEWCYDYHDEELSFACNVNKYPTPEEQYRLIKSYVNHRPEYPHPGASTPVLTPVTTPTMGPSTPSLAPATGGSTSSIAEFMLDARVPPGGWKEEEKRREDQTEEQIKSLIEEARLWRPICSAMWIAWGIMQAKIPGLDPVGAPEKAQGSEPGAVAAPEEEEEGDDQGFDYLGYAQQRAMFFWGDCVNLGLVKLEDLPEIVRNNIKLTQH